MGGKQDQIDCKAPKEGDVRETDVASWEKKAFLIELSEIEGMPTQEKNSLPLKVFKPGVGDNLTGRLSRRSKY